MEVNAMSDVTPATTVVPARRGVNPWHIVTGVLVLIILIFWIVGGVNARAFARQIEQLKTDQQARITQLAETHEKSLALAVARGMQMVNPALLTDTGQQNALTYFKGLLADKQISFVVLYDRDGKVCASTNLRVDQKRVPAKSGTVTVSQSSIAGADIEAYGPIFDAAGQQIGSVLVGVAKISGQ